MLKPLLKITALGFIVSLLLLVIAGLLGGAGYIGEHMDPGEPFKTARPGLVAAPKGSSGDEQKQILFGDFHVHTTFSADAMATSLPFMQGDGIHPPADACDFARFCSALDFWSINDHAESLSLRHWQETKETIRQCNAATDPNNPDTVAFLGFEWTQAERFDVENHYGHKNVIFYETSEDKVPPRPLGAYQVLMEEMRNTLDYPKRVLLSSASYLLGEEYRNMARYWHDANQPPLCDENADTKDLPLNCREFTATPTELFRKLDEGQYKAMVIPHGNSWGMYTAETSSWDKQLKGAMHNEKYQNLIEVFSGHGNSEEYRDWRSYQLADDGSRICPEETEDYLPICVQAGRIIKRNCLAAGVDEQECSRREVLARQHSVNTDLLEDSIPNTEVDDWLDAGQCRDCWAAAYDYRPGGSTQYALALGNFDDATKPPRRFRFGMLASSDNHSARPGTGYKEIYRRPFTDTSGVASETFYKNVMKNGEPPVITEEAKSKARDGITNLHVERSGSFYLTGGLVAVHAKSKRREDIWQAVGQKEVYGTSGDRILLWFDLLNARDDGLATPMGSEVAMAQNPKFKVTALGAFKQLPGCPNYGDKHLSDDRLEALCKGECFNPSDERKLITRIEIIRIRPQMSPDENIAGLIEDVWLTHQCEPSVDGCSFEFEDPEFERSGRETVYYARVMEAASDMVNGDMLRTQFNEKGQAVEVDPCYGSGFKTPYEENCLASKEERAWSSPIFVDYEALSTVSRDAESLI